MNKMRFSVLSFVSVMTALTVQAVPSIPANSVGLALNDTGSLVVSYTLGGDEPAVVTVDFQQKAGDVWTSIGEENFAGVFGDVNRIVQPGARKIYWNGRADWPEHAAELANLRAVVKAWEVTVPPDYMVVNLADKWAPRHYYVSAKALPGGLLANKDYRLNKLVLRRIPAAEVKWRMGLAKEAGTTKEWYQQLGEYPPRYAVLSKDYYFGVFPVTQGQFKKVIGGLPSDQKHDTSWTTEEIAMCPVNNVSMQNLRGTPTEEHYCSYLHGSEVSPDSWMQKFRDITGGAIEFDIPTEAEWEYAARAGTSSECYAGAWNMVPECGWYSGKSNGHTHPVGTFTGSRPVNPWGLYDIVGNVLEPVKDASVSDRSGFAERDPMGTVDGCSGPWVTKGGYYSSEDVKCRVTFYEPLNTYWTPSGIRLVCPAVAK